MENKIKSVGGFFEFELPRVNNEWHDGAVALSTGRACLSLFFQVMQPKKVHVPFYTCDALLAPFLTSNIDFVFYEIDAQLDPIVLPTLDDDTYFLYINFFGIKSNYLPVLIETYKDRLIIDNTQAFYEQGYAQKCWSFNSARKFFGVLDGAYLYSVKPVEIDIPHSSTTYNYKYLVDRLLGKNDCAYHGFLSNEARLNSTIKKPMDLSVRLLLSVDYEATKKRRNENFRVMHRFFEKYNLISIEIENIDGPMCYPLMIEKEIDKSLFHLNNFFVPSYWNDVLVRSGHGFEIEKDFSKRLLPLPIDQRYSGNDLLPLIQFVLNEL